MILIVILIIGLFGIAPFGFGGELGEPDCARVTEASPALPNDCRDERREAPLPPVGGCEASSASLLMEGGAGLLLVDPRTAAVREAPLGPGVARVVERGWRQLTGIVPRRWHVEWASSDLEQVITVYDRQSGEPVFDVPFARRIELSTALVSPTGRYTVHVQANNVASGVTVLDAHVGTVRSLDIPHGARLAAFAIGVAFSPGETCAAISMERVGGDGAETWLLDLDSGELGRLPVHDAFVLAWVWSQV